LSACERIDVGDETRDAVATRGGLAEPAADLLGQDRTYLLWLAPEWEKTAAREPLPPSRRAPSGGTAARRTGRTAAQRAE